MECGDKLRDEGAAAKPASAKALQMVGDEGLEEMAGGREGLHKPPRMRDALDGANAQVCE